MSQEEDVFGLTESPANLQMEHSYEDARVTDLTYRSQDGDYTVMADNWRLSDEDFEPINITVRGSSFTLEDTSDYRELLSEVQGLNYGIQISIAHDDAIRYLNSPNAESESHANPLPEDINDILDGGRLDKMPVELAAGESFEQKEEANRWVDEVLDEMDSVYEDV